MNKMIISLLFLLCYATPLVSSSALKRQKTTHAAAEEPEKVGGTEPVENDEQGIHDEFLDAQITKHGNPTAALASLLQETRIQKPHQVEYLIGKNADILHRGYATRTLLMLAAWQSDVTVFKFLMQKLSDFELVDTDDKTAAFFAASGPSFGTHMPLLFNAGAYTPGQEIINCDNNIQKQQRSLLKALLLQLHALLSDSLSSTLAIGKTEQNGGPLIHLIIEYMHPSAAKILAFKE